MKASSGVKPNVVAIAAMSGVVVGFLGGFKTASTLYADDKAKQAMERKAMTMAACAVAFVGFVGFGVKMVTMSN